MSGTSAAVPSTSDYAPTSSTATRGAAQTADLSACVITLPVSLLVSVADVEIYGKALTSAAPLIDCSGTLPLDALVGADVASSAVAFVQDPANPDLVVASVPAEFSDLPGGKFASGFDSTLAKPVMLKSLDANAYLWWNDEGKSIATDPNFNNKNSVLYNFANFPQFVVAKIAYDVFGHPMAQAGIANDSAIVGELTGTSGTAGSIGTRLAVAFKALSAAQLQSIYEQMLQQDPNRFNLEDASGGALGSNGSSATGLPRILPFKNGDSIRFEVILDDYDVKRVALNATAANGVTSASGAQIASGITATSVQAGTVLTTRYAGMKTTVQMKVKAPAPPNDTEALARAEIDKYADLARAAVVRTGIANGEDFSVYTPASASVYDSVRLAAQNTYDSERAAGASVQNAWASAVNTANSLSTSSQVAALRAEIEALAQLARANAVARSLDGDAAYQFVKEQATDEFNNLMTQTGADVVGSWTLAKAKAQTLIDALPLTPAQVAVFTAEIERLAEIARAGVMSRGIANGEDLATYTASSQAAYDDVKAAAAAKYSTELSGGATERAARVAAELEAGTRTVFHVNQ